MSRVVIRPSVATLTTYVIRTTTSAYVLPDATTVTGRLYVVKAVGVTVTVTSDGGTIDGVATMIVDGTNSATFYSDGTNWHII